MSGTVSPVQSRRLSRALRRWRERAGYSVERAAEELLCGAGTVSRMETGQSAEPLRVKAALELYGAPPAVVAEMIEAAKQRRRRGVLRRPYYDFVSQNFAEYLDLENEAAELRCVQSDLVHGLLQTKDYAHALIDSAGELIEAVDRDKFLRLRMERQQRLIADNPLVLRVIMAESVLSTEIGGPRVLSDQLQYLAELAEGAANVEVRMWPFTAGGHPLVNCSFTILAFSGPDGGPESEVVHSENPLFFVLRDDPEEVARVQRIYDQVWETALGAVASVDMIRHAQSKIAQRSRREG
ncbi:helix-turn-helix domain-containing protein [Actinokineospora sp.]|uniref:helix-turn-helix domain-containing protein n=1 Tax=Actinokineospora sp. TaxID=1872133 RepID=UPI004037A4DC